MDRWTGVCRGVALVLGVLLMAQPVCAQTAQPARPYRALFGGDASNQRSLHALDLTVALNAGADNGIVPPKASPLDSPGTPASSEFAAIYSAGAQLSYLLQGSRTGLAVKGSTSFPYYSTLPDVQDLAYGTSAHLRFASGPTSMSASGSFSYSPYYSPAFDPGSGPVLPGGDYGSALSPNNLTAAAASLTRRFGRSTSMSVGYSLSGVVFVDEDRSSLNQSARLGADHRLSRRVNVTGSYGYSTSDYTTAGIPDASRSHDLDVGFGYTHPFSRDRPFTLGMTVGASLVDYRQTQEQGWRGSASVSQGFSDNWSAGAGYSRSLRFETAIQQPVWSDDVSASANGRFGSRVDLSFGAAYSRGDRVAQTGRSFDSYSGSARLRVALARFVAVTADYVYYRYDYPVGYDLPAGVPRNMDRQRVQIGANFWVPLLRAGRARATRPSGNQ
jgi:hypothetical protein